MPLELDLDHLQVASPVAGVGLEIVALGPLVPGLDQDKTLLRRDAGDLREGGLDSRGC
jgi:hypothetical protein